ncbi:hypothetical protein CAC42_3793 [Sphaceloma murrayae]|uniref:DNA endonuclease activator Ctp1 C-terminal domain-containing protein n=1 Tax=Sphaceloma murrayae TaxID=2082308 RepID=A0A2K1QH80_9PEZI|nr:hypothetical protein CAC42_3793 [Sphaceloma murrayae]
MEDVVSGDQYRQLQADFDALQREYEGALTQLNRARKKILRYRETSLAWQRYVDSHPKYVDKRETSKPSPRLETPQSVSVTHASEIPGGQGAPSDGELARPAIKSEDDATNAGCGVADAGLPVVDYSRLQVTVDIAPTAQTTHRSSSQSTQIDSDDIVDRHGVAEPPQDDDEPEVISARQVRKPRATRSSGPTRIKHEDSGSTQNISNVPAFLRTSTQMSDLDQLLQHVETPKKRQRLIGLQEEGEEARTIRASRAEKLNSLLRECKDENTPPSASQRSRESQRSSASRPRSSGGPLQSLSTNTPILPRTSDLGARGHKLVDDSFEERTAQHVGHLAEDGTDFLSPDRQKARTVRRLDGLLQGEGAKKNFITPRAQSGSRPPPLKRTIDPPTPIASKATSFTNKPKSSRNVTSPLESPRAAKRTSSPQPLRKHPAKRPRTSQSPPPSPQPEEEPLRCRPLHRLTPDDFKINPLYAGTDFAFNAPLRDHASRRCIPGCTRPCCASIQAFAADSMRGRPATRTTVAEEDALLREHLGHDPLHLTSSQRTSLLESAKAQKVADRYGKHRQVFERRRTPPGFWRTEMPSTQELEEDRRQAKRVDREVVEERWREAVRGDGKGRWVFRDEGR